MVPDSTPSMGRFQRIIFSPSLWLVIAMLASGVLLTTAHSYGHYPSPYAAR